MKGPLLLACNHPNSFMDAVILDILFDEPIHSLARGDAFIHPAVNRLLAAVKILPVYRTSEGVENISSNYKTFDTCREIFRRKGVVLIFSEGLCENEWLLRPLKKGTARLALQSWDENIPLKVLPIGINYSSFRRFGKNVFINIGTPIESGAVPNGKGEGLRIQQFNSILRKELDQLVYTIDSNDREKMETLLEVKPSLAEKISLFIPAILGWILHWPLYTTVITAIGVRYKNTVHYDSIVAVSLILTYPFYILGVTWIAYSIFSTVTVGWLLLIFPFTAWAFTRLKPQLDSTFATASNVFH